MKFNNVFDSDTRIFESMLSQYFDNSFVLSVCNATIGILGTFYALGLENCEVITTPLTWNGALSGMKLLNNKLRYAEIEEPTLTISPESVRKLLTAKTKAVFSADLLGYPVRLDMLKEICNEHHIYLIHDAASSFGSKYKGKYSGYYADVCIHSFNRNKVFITGEGGVISSRDETIYEKLVMHLAHPERQEIEFFTYNTWALNTNMNPVAIRYGIETFEQQTANMEKQKKRVCNLLKETAFFDIFSCDMSPNFYRPVMNTKILGNACNFHYEDLERYVRNIPNKKMPGIDNHKIIKELCY
jgi:perosamine synthetase